MVFRRKKSLKTSGSRISSKGSKAHSTVALGSYLVVPHSVIKDISGKDPTNKVKESLSKLTQLYDNGSDHNGSGHKVSQKDGNCRQDFCSLGEPTVIVMVMKQHSSDPGIQAECCSALQMISVDRETRKRVTSAGGIQAVITAMRNFPRDAKLIELGCGALNNMFYENTEWKTDLYKSVAVSAIVDAMNDHPIHQGVKQSALSALRVFFDQGREAQQRILNSGGLVTVAKAAETKIKSNPQIKQAYFKALYLMLKRSSSRSSKQPLAANRNCCSDYSYSSDASSPTNKLDSWLTSSIPGNDILGNLGDEILSGMDAFNNDREDTRVPQSVYQGSNKSILSALQDVFEGGDDGDEDVRLSAASRGNRGKNKKTGVNATNEQCNLASVNSILKAIKGSELHESLLSPLNDGEDDFFYSYFNW